MHSAIYAGVVRHRRHGAVAHAFSYRLFMMYLDLDELPALFAGRWLWSSTRPALAWFRRSDHLGDPAQPLADAVRDLIEARIGRRPGGPIRLLTNLRYFGYCFNPISLYYCFAADGVGLEAVVAEVHNTPWGERHCYVLDVPPGDLGAAAGARPADSGVRHRQCDKTLHVSPFMPMDCRYDFLLKPPGKRLALRVQSRHNGVRLFDAALVLYRAEISSRALAGALLRHPFMTGKIITAIYFEALRLWLKGIPFVPHPSTQAPAHPMR